VHDDEGKLVYFFASQIDVTEFRKIQILEASEHRLLKEVDHRARNALAVVNSIVRLSRADDAIQKRVGVLAQAHTLLAERGWKEIPLHEVIGDQLRRVDAARISFAGDHVMISALFVQPVALVIHELLDNAMRHGALSVPRGSLNVSWTRSGDYGGFNLRWQEKGAPSFDADPRSGFGGAMIAGMVEKQLRGQIEREWADEGLTIVLRIPGEIAAPKRE